MQLRGKQQRFVDEYLVDLNATQAAIRAGYSAKNADKIGSELLGKTRVAEAIQSAQEARGRRVHLTQDKVLEEIALLSHSDLTHYVVDDHGTLTLAEGAPAHAMRAVSGLKKKIIHTEAGIIYEVEFKLWNKPASVRMAGEHLGTFKDGVVQSADIQAAHAARQTAVQHVHDLLARIRARYNHAAQVGVHEPLSS